MIERLSVAGAAYVAVLVQIGMLAAWPIIGGQPHLIAIGATVFLLLHRPVLGLWWIVCGGMLLDLLLPFRFGVTLIPLLLSYTACAVLLRWAIDGATWWSTILIGLVIVTATQLPLTVLTGAWRQLAYDLGAAVVLLLPIGVILGYLLAPVRSGLRISRP